MKKLLATLAILALAAPVFAQSMAGGYVDLLGPTSVNPGDTGVEFSFYVFNGSVDTEWTANVIFTFPACFTCTGGWYDDSASSNGWFFAVNPAGNVCSFDDDDGGYGEIYDGEGGWFYVTVDVGGDCTSGPAMVHWFQQGDIWGDDPHYIEGDLDFTIGGTAAATTSISNVKALY